MQTKLTTTQFWKLYQELPQEIKDMLFSEDTTDAIYNICKNNDIENDLERISDFAGQVLFGIAPAENTAEALGQMGIKKTIIPKIAHELNRFVFYPVKSALEQMKIQSSTPTIGLEIKEASDVQSEKVSVEKPPTTKTNRRKSDTYRESIE